MYEFWHEHLINYVKTLHTQPDERVKMIQELLSTFTSSQDQSALRALGSDSGAAVIEASTLDIEAGTLHTIPIAVQQHIAHRKSTSVKQSSSTGQLKSNSDLAKTDPTWISTAYKNFQAAFEDLLTDAFNLTYDDIIAKYNQMSVSLNDIQTFKTRHGKSAYLCRWSGCVWAFAGFQSHAERDKHEKIHKQQFRCPDPSCDFASSGFASSFALRKHKQKYHVKVDDHVLPAFVDSKDQLDVKSETSNPKIEPDNDDDDISTFNDNMNDDFLQLFESGHQLSEEKLDHFQVSESHYGPNQNRHRDITERLDDSEVWYSVSPWIPSSPDVDENLLHLYSTEKRSGLF